MLMKSLKKKSVVTIAHVTSSLKQGGAEEILCSLVEHLDPATFTSHVLYFHDGPHSSRLRQAGIHIHQIRGFICMYDPVFWCRLVRTLHSINPDCIHALLWSAQITCRVLGRLLRIPVVTVYHNQANLESGMRLFLDKITLTCATKIVAVSHTVAQSITRSHSFVLGSQPESRIITIPNGISRQQLDHACATTQISKKELRLPENAIVIGTVGRLHPVKNHPLLLCAYALVHKQNPNTYLMLVGDGPEQRNLTALVQRMQLRDQVLFVTGKQAYPYYPLFDCFVLPSAQEGMSMALLEAHYFKRACVVAHPTTSHDIIEHGYNGLLVEPNNAHALAQAIDTVLNSRTLCNTLGNNAHNHVVQKHTIEHMVNHYEQIFKESVRLTTKHR